MKKFITVSTAVALFGAALLFVGCTKDYGQDISDVKKDVEQLQSDVATANKNIETLQTSVKELQDAKTKLEEADKDLQNQITSLDSKKANKTDLESVKTELQKADAELQKQITSINSTLKDVQSTLALKADKSYVDKTFATQEALDKVSQTLGELSKTVEKIDKRLTNVENVVDTLSSTGGVTKILERLSDVETGLSKANQAITDLGNELHTLYYTSGQIDAMLNYQDSVIRKTLIDSALNIRTAINELNDKFVQEVTDRANADGVLQDAIDAEKRARLAADALLRYSIDSLGTDLIGEKSYRKTVDDSIYLALCGEIDDRKDADKESADSLNAKILKEIADRFQADKESADSLNAKIVKEINDRIVECGNLQDQIDDIIGDIEGETLKKLRTDVDAINKQIKEQLIPRFEAIEGYTYDRFDAVSKRVTSISVCPTLTPEYVTVVTGNPQLISNFQYMLVADFAIEPASKVDEIVAAYKDNKNPLYLGYTWAMSRCKSEVQYNLGQITSVYKVDNETLRVVATKIEQAEERIQNKRLFYALEYQSTDSLGKYSVMSDFVEAIESTDPFEMTNCFKYAKMNGENIEILALNDNDEYRDTTEYDYIAADTLKKCLTRFGGTKEQTDEKPFLDKFVAVETDFTGLMAKIFPKSAYTVDEYEALTGQEVKLEYTHRTDTDYPVIFNHLPENDFGIDVYFEPESPRSMFQYVSDQSYPARMYFEVNGVASPYGLIKDYMITKKKHPEVTLPDTYITWNYKQYKNEERKDTLDASKDTLGYKANLWNEARTKGAEVTTNFVNKWLVYSDSSNGYQPLYIEINGRQYDNDLTDSEMQGLGGSTKKEVITFCVKETYSDWYKFNLKTTIENPLMVYAMPEDQTLDGSVTLSRVFTIKDIDTLYISPNKTQTVRERLISGLTGDDRTFASVKKAFDEQFKACTLEVRMKKHTEASYTDITDKVQYTDPNDVYNSATGDLTLTLKPGTITYDEDVNILIKVKNIFGRTYQIAQTIKTKSPKYRLAYNDKYVKDTTVNQGFAEVRGKFGQDNISGRYTIEEMHYVNYWKLVGDFSDEADDAIFKLSFDNAYVPADEWGQGEGTSGRIAYNDVTFIQGHKLDYADVMTWNSDAQVAQASNYKATYFMMSPHLKVSTNDGSVVADFSRFSSTVNKAVKFYTKAPLKFSASTYAISDTRIAGKDLTFNLYKNVQVYGFYDNGNTGTWTTNLYQNGNFITTKYYGGAQVKYIIPEDGIVTSDGKYTLIRKQDYDFSENDDRKITILAESAIAEDFTFTIKAYLYNDFDHLKYEDGTVDNKFNDKVVNTIDITVTVKQK